MPLRLHTIKPGKGAIKKRKRVGRGNSSGHGTYSGRGLKGQRSRSGGKSGLKRLGMKGVILNIPKKRGFKSDKPKNQVINLVDLNKFYKDGETVSQKSLAKKGLISSIKIKSRVNSRIIHVKILGKGKLKVKNLKFENIKASESVKKQIKKMKGEIIEPVAGNKK